MNILITKSDYISKTKNRTKKKHLCKKLASGQFQSTQPIWPILKKAAYLGLLLILLLIYTMTHMILYICLSNSGAFRSNILIWKHSFQWQSDYEVYAVPRHWTEHSVQYRIDQTFDFEIYIFICIYSRVNSTSIETCFLLLFVHLSFITPREYCRTNIVIKGVKLNL